MILKSSNQYKSVHIFLNYTVHKVPLNIADLCEKMQSAIIFFAKN